MRQALLNRKEVDVRRSMAEAVSDYPNVEDQRGIININHAKTDGPPAPQSQHERF